MQPTGAPPVRYEPFRGEDHPPRMPGARMAAIATAPLLGSRAIFPARFRRAVARLLQDSRAASIPVEHAFHFFGRSLLVRVDPAVLERQIVDEVADGSRHVRLAHRFLDGGDWKALEKPFDQARAHREILQLLKYPSVEDTPTYRNFVRLAEAGRPKLRNGIPLGSAIAVRHYLEQYRRLIDSVRSHGILPRHHVPSGERVFSLARTFRVEWWERDTGIAVDADGRLLRMVGGRHRTAIAQVLGLPAMPVEIRMVHVRWLEKLTRETGLPADRALLAWIASPGFAATAGLPASLP